MRSALLASIALALAACAAGARSGGPLPGGPRDGGGDGDSGIGTPPRCGGEKLTAAPVVPSLLVALDRSCSMTQKIGASSKWQLAVAALQKLTTSWAGKVRFGLTLFPDRADPQCDQGAIPIPVGSGNEAAMQSLLSAALAPTDALYPNGPCVTPIDAGLHQATLDPGLADPAHPGYVLLITDGAQAGCSQYGGAPGAVKIVGSLAAAGVHSFVVGFGGAVDVNELDALAKAGGEPATGAHAFYDATDGPGLDAALGAVAHKTFGCVYQLAVPPPDPSLVYVFFDQMGVARDATHTAGWDYDPASNQVRFYGASCAQLGSGSVKVLDIVFGCDAPPIQ